MIIVGIDPDSTAHGVAVYRDGELTELAELSLPQIRQWIAALESTNNLIFSIENVLAQNFVYSRNALGKKAAHAKVALSVGRCQQAQAELMRELDFMGIAYEVHAPTGYNWAKNKDQFAKQTGWKGSSNVETRSAAFFGWVALSARSRHASK
ncbi:hypothetical protein PHACT_12645 [Pseudohongiella acticola]|uniref:Uncharacterized protein n=1 Tax=Pseudohongiella acticola TaxID=1524254 RepID=A0A1E8CGD8_9GAMM|nr:hypothetical protein [Pseudohongiella acticola]OFE11399.1 hypothetical protein PHACT_12645 [Pseudohongiella acticola]